MRRIHALLLLGSTFGCSTATPAVVDDVVAARSTASRASVAGEPERAPEGASATERELRHRVAEGGEPGVTAAIVLAERLVTVEAHAEALAVVRAAAANAGDRDGLALCEARLLADLGRWDEAVARLRARLPRDARPPVLLAALAEFEYVRRDFDAFDALFRELDREAELPDAERLHLADLARSVARLRSDGARPPVLSIEVLAALRAGAGTRVREAAFAVSANTPDLRWSAMRAALANTDPALRIVALRALTPDDVVADAAVEALCADQDPRVRAVAATVASRLRLPPELLLDRLAVERDPYTYRCVHEALRQRVGPFVTLAPGRDLDPDVRRNNLDAWRRHWNR